MQFRSLGRSGISIAPIMLGGNVFGWTADKQASFSVLDAFVDAGFNAIDTADSYSRFARGNKGGESETMIGTWLKKSGKRSKVIVATKVGSDMGEGKNIRRNYILRAAEDSLKRLQTDVIDLYQTHFDDEVTPVEETLGAYAQLIKDGKVRAIGASNVTPARIRASQAAAAKAGIPRYETLQPLYNLYDRSDYETNYAPLAEEEGLGVIPYWALAAGFFSGKYRVLADTEKVARGAKVKAYLNERGLGILKALDTIATKHQATVAQTALAWIIARPSITAPIVSATSVAQLQDILRAPRIALSKDDIVALELVSAQGSSDT